MTPERYRRIEQVYEAALELPGPERAEFVSSACAGDENLRREVTSLLDAHQEAGGFLEAPPDDLAAAMVNAEQQSRSILGRRLGHYQVRTTLGSGGMGEIYLAQDLTLERSVALKVLPPHFTLDADRMRRFVQEAKAASALSHPNVAHIYEIAESDGISFIALEYVEGQTLEARIKASPLSPREIVEIALQVGDALEAAHAKGIVHRDVKPANIMLTPRGQVKILDFGLAKIAAAGTERLAVSSAAPVRTEPGVLMGTADYMSPEQALGQEVDARTDIFSLGAAMYEMASGKRPFSGRTTGETLDRIIHQEPAIAELSPRIPADLISIVLKCLEKDPNRRYRSARELILDLNGLKQRLTASRGPTPVGAERSHRQSIAARRSAIAGLAVLAVATGVYVWLSRGMPGTHARPIRSLAVLPLKSFSGDSRDEYLGLGLADTLIAKLSNIRSLVVRSSTTVRKYNGPDQDPLTAGHEQQVDAVLEGSIYRAGDRLRVTVRLLRVQDGSTLWASQYDERQYTDIFAVQDSISERVAEALTLSLTAPERKLLAKHYTESSDAYLFYLRGRSSWNKRTGEGFTKAIDYFNQAIENDSNYALAYVGLADCYTMLADYDWLPPTEAAKKAKGAITKALQIDDSLAEAHASLADIRRFFDWDWSGAEKEYKRGIELNPNYVSAHQWYAEYLAAMGRHDEAIREMRRAEELDPLSVVIKSAAGWIFFFSHDYELAIERCQRVIEMDPGYGEVYSQLRRAYEQKGMYGEALAADEKLRAFKRKGAPGLAGVRTPPAIQSPGEYWRNIMRLTQNDLQSPDHKNAAQFRMAEIFAQLGETDLAFEWLEKAYQEHSFWLPFLNVHPHLDPLRADPRFQSLLARVGLAH